MGRRTWREGFKHIHLLENEWRENQTDGNDGHDLAEGTKETPGNSRVRQHHPFSEYGHYAGSVSVSVPGRPHCFRISRDKRIVILILIFSTSQLLRHVSTMDQKGRESRGM